MASARSHQRDLRSVHVEAALGDFDQVWDAMKPREQSRLLFLLVAKVEFDAGDNSIVLQFHPTAIKSLQERR